MKTKTLIAALLVSAAMPMMAAHAETPAGTTYDGKKAEWRKKWDAATPEERAKMKEAHHKRMEERHAKWENATPEERAKMKAAKEAKWKERYDKASPEEKKRMDERKAKMDEHRAKWEAASPEERAKMKEAWKEKRMHHKGPHDGPKPEVAPKQ